MEGEELYSVKWYKAGHEFYRYIPTDTPDTTVFPYPGIDVDVSREMSFYLMCTDNSTNT